MATETTQLRANASFLKNARGDDFGGGAVKDADDLTV